MATEATDAPQVFARKATGLRREASARDVFIYNTNNQNVGIGVAFVVLLVPAFYAGASMLTATILAGLLALPMACVYAYFASAMPRSGGDHVYIVPNGRKTATAMANDSLASRKRPREDPFPVAEPVMAPERLRVQAASWKMIPRVVRSPPSTVATPWRIAAR